jgi:hypothetical protein
VFGGRRSETRLLKYIELKTGYSGNGPAWIAQVTVSKTARTVYFNGKALKRTSSARAAANHYDLETGQEYWVSGIKKNGRDRHWAGAGKIHIEASVVRDYLELVGTAELDVSRFEVVADLPTTHKDRLVALENQSRGS